MGTQTEKGQTVIEFALGAFFLASLFLVVMSLSKRVLIEQRTSRFHQQKEMKWISKPSI